MCKTLQPPPAHRLLRSQLGQFPTGVAVVTAEDECGQPVGMTINSFQSISLTPALVGWCIDRRSASYPVFAQAERFAISVLHEGQRNIAEHFAKRGADKFAGLTVRTGKPLVIPSACAWFQCQTYSRFLLGDHMMLVGEVIDSDSREASPLVFAQGRFQALPRDFVPNVPSQPTAIIRTATAWQAL